MKSTPPWGRRNKLACPTFALAFALLLSFGTQYHGTNASPLAIATNNKQQRHLGGKADKPGNNSSTPAQPHRTHHHGGGKHDTGANGHHPNNKNTGTANAAKTNKPPTAAQTTAARGNGSGSGGGTKSGKAVSAPAAAVNENTPFPTPHDDGAYSADDHAKPTYHPTTNSEEYTNVVMNSGKAAKNHIKGNDDYEAADDGDDDSGGGGGGVASGKSGKATYTDDDGYDDDHHDDSVSDAKSGKAIMSYDTHKGGDSSTTTHTIDAKSGKATTVVVEGTTKPKAEKAPLTEYFVKEPSHGDDSGGGDSKSGKSSDGATHSPTMMLYSGKSGKASSGGDYDGGGTAAKASKTHAPGMSYGDEQPPIVWPKTPQPTEVIGIPPPPTDGGSGTPPSPATPVTSSPVTTPEPVPATPPPTPPPTPEVTPPPVPAVTLPPVTAAPATPPPVDVPEVPTMPTDLLTLPPTLSLSPTPLDPDSIVEGTLPSDDVARVAPAPSNTYPTYSPTALPTSDDDGNLQPRLSNPQDSNTQQAILEPFGLKLYANVAEPTAFEDTVKRVTMEHLVHSFRTKDYVVDTLDLMVLTEDRHLMRHAPGNVASAMSPMTDRWLVQHPVYELVFGGVLNFPHGREVPSEEAMDAIVKASFSGERLTYYIELLEEAGVDVDRVKLGTNLEGPPGDGSANSSNGSDGEGGSFSWAGLTIGLSSAIGGIGLIAVGSRVFYKRRERHILSIVDDLDLEKGDYAIRLQYTNDEIEAFPGSSTIAETMTGSEDHLSVPSLVRGVEEDQIDFDTPNTHNSSSSTISDDLASISPLESPHDVGGSSDAKSAAPTTRYVSVFTVKKDCGNKSLDEIDLRALAIAYLSRMLKKFPNTHLLPYNKHAPLPAITNIRNIPDDLEELRQYVGNARLDDKTGKVLFNLRVESDEPVSKMKHGSGSAGGSSSSSRGGLGKKFGSSSKKKQVTSVKSIDEMEKEEMPKSPGVFEDVKF